MVLISVHAIGLLFFLTFSVIFGILIADPALLNAWIVSIVFGSIGVIFLIALLTIVSQFDQKNVSNLETETVVSYSSGLVHVREITLSSLIFVLAILFPLSIQISFLVVESSPCCSWDGAAFETSRFFAATQILSLFFLMLAFVWSARIIVVDLVPLRQLTEVLTRKDH